MRSAVLLLLGLVQAGAAVPSVVHAGPGEPYRWVDPPAAVAPANVAPQGRLAEVPAGPDAMVPVEVWTPDLQATVAIGGGPLRVAPGRTSIPVAITPRSTTGLAPLPRSAIAAGNVYEVSVGERVTGTLVLATAHEPTGALFSEDGRAWTAVELVASTAVEARVDYRGAGLYLATTDHASTELPAGPGGAGGVPTWVVLVVLAAALVTLAVAAGTRTSSRNAGG